MADTQEELQYLCSWERGMTCPNKSAVVSLSTLDTSKSAIFRLVFCLSISSHPAQHNIWFLPHLSDDLTMQCGEPVREMTEVSTVSSRRRHWLKRLSSAEVESDRRCVRVWCVVYVRVSMCVLPCVDAHIHECYCVTTAQFIDGEWLERCHHHHVDLKKQEQRKQTGSGQANPTSTEAVEAVVQGLKNNYLTFKDRSRGISLEHKWSNKRRSCIPAI